MHCFLLEGLVLDMRGQKKKGRLFFSFLAGNRADVFLLGSIPPSPRSYVVELMHNYGVSRVKLMNGICSIFSLSYEVLCMKILCSFVTVV